MSMVKPGVSFGFVLARVERSARRPGRAAGPLAPTGSAARDPADEVHAAMPARWYRQGTPVAFLEFGLGRFNRISGRRSHRTGDGVRSQVAAT
jgi:GGDEF domain-containing protein